MRFWVSSIKTKNHYKIITTHWAKKTVSPSTTGVENRNGSTSLYLQEYKIVVTVSSLVFSYQLNMQLLYDPVIILLGMDPREIKASYKNLQANTQSSFICNSQKLR